MARTNTSCPKRSSCSNNKTVSKTPPPRCRSLLSRCKVLSNHFLQTQITTITPMVASSTTPKTPFRCVSISTDRSPLKTKAEEHMMMHIIKMPTMMEAVISTRCCQLIHISIFSPDNWLHGQGWKGSGQRRSEMTRFWLGTSLHLRIMMQNDWHQKHDLLSQMHKVEEIVLFRWVVLTYKNHLSRKEVRYCRTTTLLKVRTRPYLEALPPVKAS